MTREASVTRDMILQRMTEELKPLDYVHAFWEGGAVGHGRLDEWSDMDLYLLVDDERVGDAFDVLESVLTSLSPIEVRYRIGQTGYPGVHQNFYLLERTSQFLVLDIAVVTMSAPDKFVEEEMHGKPVFFFSKTEMPASVLDRTDLRERIRMRLPRLRARMDLFHIFVQKELNRGHAIEAVDVYNTVVLGSLTELLRIRYCPVHYEFHTRYLYSELPEAIVRRLEELYFVRDTGDLEQKYHLARKWFDDLYEEVDAIGTERLADR